MTTVTIELPDDLAARLFTLPPEEINRYAVAAFARLMQDQNRTDKTHSVLEFNGVGAGRHGAIGPDVAGYINGLRDEWDRK